MKTYTHEEVAAMLASLSATQTQVQDIKGALNQLSEYLNGLDIKINFNKLEESQDRNNRSLLDQKKTIDELEAKRQRLQAGYKNFTGSTFREIEGLEESAKEQVQTTDAITQNLEATSVDFNDRLIELENHDKRSLALIDKIRGEVQKLLISDNLTMQCLEEHDKRLDTQAKGLNGLGKELRGRIEHLESLSLPPTDHGKYQKLVELCSDHTSNDPKRAWYKNHDDIKAALEELDA